MTGPDTAAADENNAEAVALAKDPFISLRDGGAEIYLIRHADALPGADEVADGDYNDQALSEIGRRQARALGEALQDITFDAVYSSPIPRAMQTAVAVAAPHALDVRTEPELREIELGPIGPESGDGATAEERAKALRDRLHDIAVVALGSGNWSSIPGSEPSEDLRARMVAVVDRLARTHAGQRIAAISHGGAINAYFAAILGIPRDYFFPCANTSVSVVRVKGPRQLLLTLNDVAHLRAAGLLGVGRSDERR